VKKKFTVLRIIGTLWKVLAWIALVLGIIASVGVLLAGVLGGPMMRQTIPVPEGASWAYSVAGGIIGFIAMLIGTIVYFLMMYAVGELIYLLIAIEENTRHASEQIQWMAQQVPEADYTPPPAAYSAPIAYSQPAPTAGEDETAM
jgi:hypothetical protein